MTQSPSPIVDEVAVQWPGRKFCETAERNVAELAKCRTQAPRIERRSAPAAEKWKGVVMKIDKHEDDLRLPSGRVLSPHCGIIGIDAGGGVYGGYDDELTYGDEFSQEDRQYLAEIMIARWRAYAAGLGLLRKSGTQPSGDA